jgi:cell division transport system permease protein
MKTMMQYFNIFQKDRKLGIAEQKGRYDLPLHQSAGKTFLIVLVGLMTFLGMMMLTTSFALHSLAGRWSSGLENAATIEIPAAHKEKNLRSDEDIAKLAKRVEEKLSTFSGVKSHTLLDKKDVSALISPWLGEDIAMDSIPLPGLISVELRDNDPETLARLQSALADISEDIRIDTHEEWLSEILQLAGGLKLGALLITALIVFVTVIAIAGAVRSRMAEHQPDIELLHLMGASDYYIMRQFQRHATAMTFKGSAAGIVGGIVCLLTIALVSGQSAQNLLPDFSLSGVQILILLCLPLFMCSIAFITARFTVLHVLRQMP